MRMSPSPAKIPPQLDIADQKINDLARNAKDLCGMKQDKTGRIWL
jgi:hypothetical protein